MATPAGCGSRTTKRRLIKPPTLIRFRPRRHRFERSRANMNHELKLTQEECVAEQEESHPSLTLKPRARGYGIGGAYEKPYVSARDKPNQRRGSYGPLPHSGYYGAGAGSTRFQRGQAGFSE